MDVREWTYLLVGLTFSLYLGIAVLARVRSTAGFYVAGRGVPALANGMATGADWMSAASFISMAGLVSFMGYTGAIYLMGWTGGYVLLALLLAPYLRKYGKFTTSEFLGDRYYGFKRRLVWWPNAARNASRCHHLLEGLPTGPPPFPAERAHQGPRSAAASDCLRRRAWAGAGRTDGRGGSSGDPAAAA